MRVIITRPAGDAPAWVDALQAAGHQALALPLIEVGPARHLQPVLQAWAHWSEWQAVMFVSAQAVRYFFDSQPAALRADAGQVTSPTWANGPRCWATGPGTHKALLQAGVPEACIDSPAADAAQFDSEALWQRVSPQVQAAKPVLIGTAVVGATTIENVYAGECQVIVNPYLADAAWLLMDLSKPGLRPVIQCRLDTVKPLILDKPTDYCAVEADEYGYAIKGIIGFEPGLWQLIAGRVS